MSEDKKQKPVDFIKYYVEPHKKISREVNDGDLKRVMKDAHIMYNLCFTQRGMFPGGFAVAHPQINNEDPLRFFVTCDKEIIINPFIKNHTKTTVNSVEGCLSYPDRERITVQRYNKVTVSYQVLSGDGTISERIEKNLNGQMAKIFQHEIDHFNGKTIFN